jgi:hypothetical protein
MDNPLLRHDVVSTPSRQKATNLCDVKNRLLVKACYWLIYSNVDMYGAIYVRTPGGLDESGRHDR